MSTETERSKLTVEELAARASAEMIPLTNAFSYFTTLPVAEDDLRQYFHDPIASLPPAVCTALGKVGLLLVPFIERANGKNAGYVEFERPPEGRQLFWTRTKAADLSVLLFGIKEVEMADYHYYFFNAVGNAVAERWEGEPQESYHRMLREELGSEVHGEVDDRSWHLKQALLRRQSNIRKETKLFREYARQSFEDTLTLYLHGICCDIDVETGPRQMPGRFLRRRLELLESLYPPPEGFTIFPEQPRKK
ncbi:MAG TPA: hypothetical protein VN442_09505 [Bryobacteraceae bacterium]|nr:hypothetical protein [Bryobacteraceae bacterium]